MPSSSAGAASAGAGASSAGASSSVPSASSPVPSGTHEASARKFMDILKDMCESVKDLQDASKRMLGEKACQLMEIEDLKEIFIEAMTQAHGGGSGGARNASSNQGKKKQNIGGGSGGAFSAAHNATSNQGKKGSGSGGASLSGGASGTEEGEIEDRMEDIADGAPSLTQLTVEDGDDAEVEGEGFSDTEVESDGADTGVESDGADTEVEERHRGALGRSAISDLT